MLRFEVFEPLHKINVHPLGLSVLPRAAESEWSWNQKEFKVLAGVGAGTGVDEILPALTLVRSRRLRLVNGLPKDFGLLGNIKTGNILEKKPVILALNNVFFKMILNAKITYNTGHD